MTTNSKLRVVVITLGALPFIFSNASWSRPACIIYVLTTVLFGILLVGEYPPPNTGWFRKAISTIVVMHVFIVAGLATLDFNIPAMNKLPRILYGYLGIVVLLEWRISLFIIEKLQPDMKIGDRRN